MTTTVVKTLVERRMESIGYSPLHTGGGCMTWHKPISGGLFIWITDEDGTGLGSRIDEKYIVGLYNGDGDYLGYQYRDNLNLAIEVASEMERNPNAFKGKGLRELQ